MATRQQEIPRTPVCANETTTFRTAVPYAIGTLAIGTAGAITAVAAVSVAVKVVGIAAAIIGAYGFFGTLICGIMHAGEPAKFKEEWPKFVTITIASAFADIIAKIATAVIYNMISNAFSSSR